MVPVSTEPAQTTENEALAKAEEEAAKRSHLRSGRAVIGYRVDAIDGDAGDLDDLAIDDETWAIRHLVVDERRWWPGGHVLVEPAAVAGVSWAERQVRVHLTREQLRQLPAGD